LPTLNLPGGYLLNLGSFPYQTNSLLSIKARSYHATTETASEATLLSWKVAINVKMYLTPLITGMSLSGRDPLYWYAYLVMVFMLPVDVAEHEVSLEGTEQVA
jgi:hypothetical protein